MNEPILVPQQDELETFIQFLFEGLEGYVYVVAKEPNDPESWDQAFFEYPAQKDVIIRAINHYSPTQEVYIAPAIYKHKNGTRESVKASNVIWTEFDGNTPDDFDIPPSMVVRSSEPGHEHVYWKLDEPISDLDALEDYNRRICYKYKADNSAWDCTQVLRPPYTINHKRNSKSVAILSSDTTLTFNTSVFDDLAPAPETSVDYTLWEKIDLPPLENVIYYNKFGPDFKMLFEKQKHEVSDRSTSLTHMAFVCAEAGLSDKEIYVVISHLAERWEKFKHHTAHSRAKNLISIIEHTRIKYPHSNNDFDQVFEYSPKALLETDIQVDWAIPNMLMKNGVLILGGESGVGKTQLSMQFMFHLAMGKDFLTYKLEEPKKIGFISCEMGDLELKAFLLSMYPKLVETYSDEDLDKLNENLKLIPFGERLPLNTPHGRDILTQYLEENQWDGVFIDSVGSVILGNISSSEVVQPWIDFNDKIRKRYNCFLWYIHHFRKAAPGTRSSGDQADLYGDQYITGKATSVYTMMKNKNGLLKIRNPKNRHAEEEKDYWIKREVGLTFSYQGDVTTPGSANEVLEQLNALNNEPPTADPSPFKDK